NGAQPHRIVAHAAYDELVRALPELKSVECIVWLGERLPAANPRNTTHVRLAERLPAAPTAAPPPIRHDDLDEVCAISYTSGTTGAPKGAMLTQRWFQVGAKNAGILADVRPSDVLFLWEPFYHVAGWMTVLMSLQHGIPMAMVEKFSA